MAKISRKAQRLAEKGDDFYFGRNGKEKNHLSALVKYLDAAYRDHPYAAYMAGLCYECGEDVEHNKKDAKYYYVKALELGYEEARERLDNLKSTKKAVITPQKKVEKEINFVEPKTIEISDVSFEDTAELIVPEQFRPNKQTAQAPAEEIEQDEFPEDMFSDIYMVRNYKGFPGYPDWERIESCLIDKMNEIYRENMLIDKEYGKLYFHVGELYMADKLGSLGKYRSGYYFETSAQYGYEKAQRFLAYCYLYGKYLGNPKGGSCENHDRASYWLFLLSEKGDEEARYQLGKLLMEDFYQGGDPVLFSELYHDGIDERKKDMLEFFYWYEKVIWHIKTERRHPTERECMVINAAAVAVAVGDDLYESFFDLAKEGLNLAVASGNADSIERKRDLVLKSTAFPWK